MRPVRVTISGSFHEDPEGLKDLYDELITTNCQVISPLAIGLADSSKKFVATDDELIMSEAEIERRHLAAIGSSDFVFIHSPEGYIGLSTALELGYAYAKKIPIFSKDIPNELVFRPIIRQVGSVYEARQKSKSVDDSTD